ncbi:polyprenyl synthetase family protein [Bacillaceae bacterium Marseille-Q3522]|nr:polyprenyl synthetase family protein [Bacillaceae bacterium Marseille-Q3522]
MNEELIINTDICYRLAEQKAAHYFQTLYEQVVQKNYFPILIKDIQSWKHHHIHPYSYLSFFSRRKKMTASKEYHKYIKWLDYTGKLDHYLDRSISYLFMRDLGKALDSSHTQTRIRRVVDSLKTHLLAKGNKTEAFSMAGLYRMAQKNGVESAMIWVINKLKNVSSNIPKEMDAVQAERKIIKIIAGVLMHEVEEMSDDLPFEKRRNKLDKAIKLGYYYGLTYPFLDDLLDAKLLSAREEKRYSDLIRTTLITGTVPVLGKWNGKNMALIQYIHSELKDAFTYMKAQKQQETWKSFLEQSYVFFKSQEEDRVKDLSYEHYTNEDLYIPVILKSASSRLIVRSLIDAPENVDFESRTFFYGVYNQLADDFADMFDDMKEGAVTPYTYYLKYHHKRPDLINPFALYWTVICHLIHHVYHSDSKTCEVILDRAVNGLKRYKERMGTKKYNEVMELFATGNQEFNRLLQKIVRKAEDVEFFDKLLRDHIIAMLKKERNEQKDFFDTLETVRRQINNSLKIPDVDLATSMKDPIIEAANYSLDGSGKRLRPIVTWMIGVHEYGLKSEAIMPLLRSLEYMHTASLIFDDLPSQDNAPLRRGRQTLHQVYNVAIAELTALFLTQKATCEQALLDQFNAKSVLHLIQYSAQMTCNMCKGQAMDLDSKGKRLALEQLNRLCFYKTGIGFEAALIMPAILADADATEMEALKKFAYHAGIAFQIKDDLLDVEGDSALLGKAIGKDRDNQHSTFVSILGSEDAKKAMWEHYCLAMEVLQDMPRNVVFLKHLLNYMVNRDR